MLHVRCVETLFVVIIMSRVLTITNNSISTNICISIVWIIYSIYILFMESNSRWYIELQRLLVVRVLYWSIIFIYYRATKAGTNYVVVAKTVYILHTTHTYVYVATYSCYMVLIISSPWAFHWARSHSLIYWCVAAWLPVYWNNILLYNIL